MVVPGLEPDAEPTTTWTPGSSWAPSGPETARVDTVPTPHVAQPGAGWSPAGGVGSAPASFGAQDAGVDEPAVVVAFPDDGGAASLRALPVDQVGSPPLGRYLPPGDVGVDPLAVAGFVLALFLWPLGLIFGVVGLRRTGGDSGRGGRRLAVAAVFVSLLMAGVSVGVWSQVYPLLGAQQAVWQEAQVTRALAQTSQWLADEQTASGSYPVILDISAPETAEVEMTLVPAAQGGAPCLQAQMGATIQHADGAEGFIIRTGACR